MAIERVVSGMRPTGSLHLGHYNGVLKNWVDLQHELECLFFVADWHALTTHYDAPEIIEKNVTSMVLIGLPQALILQTQPFLFNQRFLSMQSFIRFYQ